MHVLSPLEVYSAPGGLRQDPGRAAESSYENGTRENGSRELRTLLAKDGSRGNVEAVVGLAVQLQALGADVWVCATRAAPTRRRWPRGCRLARSAETGRPRPCEPCGTVEVGKGVSR